MDAEHLWQAFIATPILYVTAVMIAFGLGVAVMRILDAETIEACQKRLVLAKGRFELNVEELASTRRELGKLSRPSGPGDGAASAFSYDTVERSLSHIETANNAILAEIASPPVSRG